MTLPTPHRAKTVLTRLMSALTAVSLSISLAVPPPALAQTVAAPGEALALPAPGTMIAPTAEYNPPLMAGLTIHPENPLKFDFIITTGDDRLDGEDFAKESKKLINYFLAALTVPNEQLWVNLSPYEKGRIIADGLGQTEMGRDMLAQDYLLKQFTASLMYPEEELGDSFWKKVYAKSRARFGTTEIPTNTFNKVWIIPEQASVYVNGLNVFVSESRLKVMLEEDYLALESNKDSTSHGLGKMTKDDIEAISQEAKEVIREIILPEIEREVNEGKTFANLRQMYHSMILATWYKNRLEESFLGQAYMDMNKVKGIDLADKQIKDKIYEQYVEAFRRGVFNYIKEDFDEATQKFVPRRYFLGGARGVARTGVNETGTVQDASAAGRAAAGEIEARNVTAEGETIIDPNAPNDPDSRGWDGRSNPEYTPPILDALATKRFANYQIRIMEGRKVLVPSPFILDRAVTNAAGQTLEAGLIITPEEQDLKLTEAQLGTLTDALQVLPGLELFVDNLADMQIVVVPGVDHYGLGRNQIYLDPASFNDATLLRAKINHEVLERNAVLSALTPEERRVVMAQGDRSPALMEKIETVSRATHNELEAAEIAAGTRAKKGGIDFNPEAMSLQETGEGMDFQFDNTLFSEIPLNAVEGVSPVIINITPIVDFAPLLGRAEEEPEAQQLSFVR